MEQSIADVCIVGVGATGGIIAKELASAGLKLVGFERGPAPRWEDYAPRDTIKFLSRPEQLDWVKHEPTTVRTKRGQTAELRYRMQPETLPRKANRVDLDPRQRDRWGLPLPRVTFDFHQNEHRLQKFMAGVGEKIMRATGASIVWTSGKDRPNRWAGGTRMGKSAKNSVVNEQCQSRDVANLFIVGSSVFPTMAGYPPTATIAALSYRTAEFILRQKQ